MNQPNQPTYDQVYDLVEKLDAGRAHCRRLDTGELIEDAGLAVILVVAGQAVIGSRAQFEEARKRRQFGPPWSPVLIGPAVEITNGAPAL